jgi:hypothetical protein
MMMAIRCEEKTKETSAIHPNFIILSPFHRFGCATGPSIRGRERSAGG